MLHDSLMPVDRALGLAGGSRRIVHDGVVVLAGVYDVEAGRRLGHLLLIAEVGRVDRLRIAVVFVDDDYVLQLEQLRDDPGDLAAQVGLSHQDLGPAVLQPIPHRVGAEGGEQRAYHGPGLQGPKEGKVQLRQPLHVNKHPVAGLDAQALDDVGKLVGMYLHLAEGVGLLFAVLALPYHGQLVAVAAVGVPVYRLVCLVEAATRQPVQLIVHLLPVKISPHLVIVKIRLHLHGVQVLFDGGK